MLLGHFLAKRPICGAPFHRALLAGLLACLVPAAVFALFASSIGLAWLMFALAVVHFAILGVPLFSLLRWKGLANMVTSVVAGAVVGGLPAAILLFPGGERYKGSSHWSGGVAHMIDGVPTPAGWENYLTFVAQLSAFGAGIGFLFALILAAWANRDA